jgi:hypothetical protein
MNVRKVQLPSSYVVLGIKIGELRRQKREYDVCVGHEEWEGYGNKETWICPSCRK